MTLRRATPADVPLLVELMREFYAESSYPLEEPRYTQAFQALIADPRLGHAYLINESAGHVVLTISFAMEYGGLRGIVDDLYVRPAHRNQGHGRQALLDLVGIARSLGLLALTVEVSPTNAAAQGAYRRAGFQPAPDREILALPL